MSSATRDNDFRVNQAVDDIEGDVVTRADYRRLREDMARRGRTPKLVNLEDCSANTLHPLRQSRQLLRGEESAGALMVNYVVAQPGLAAGRHHQLDEDELWFAVSGEWLWTVGAKTMRVRQGGFAYIPRNTTHAFEAVGEEPAVMFTLNTPAGHERFLNGGFQLIQAGASREALEAFSAAYETVFHAPGEDE